MRKAYLTALPLLAVAILLAGCSSRKAVQDIHATTLQPQAPFWGKLLHSIYSTVEQENICLSPLSAEIALAMTATGAEGETMQQMHNVIQTGDSRYYNGLIADLRKEGKWSEMKIANSIWINRNLDVKESFKNANREMFDAQVNTIPFDSQATGLINDWCKQNTQGKINGIIDKVEPHHMMFLINALYFKASWSTPFNAKFTEKASFTTSGNSVVDVDMMKQTFNTAYYIDDVVQMATKPFKERYDMLFILPRYGKSIDDAIAHLATNYDSCINSMERYKVEFSMPKFKCEYRTSLKESLCGMGMARAFSGKAEFGGISQAPLYIDDVIQKTFINVDEEGAEAAAVTAVAVGLLAMRDQTPKSTMTLNRPFIYAIRDCATGTILFIGKVGNPNK